MISRRTLTTTAAAAVLAASRARAQAAPVVIAIQYGIGYLSVMVADKAGLFAKHAPAGAGAVVLTRMSGATAINDALISGSIQVGAYGLPGMLIAREKTQRNFDIRGLCSLSSLPYGLYTNVDGIRSVKDIGPDERIAVTAPNTPQAELLRMAAEAAFGDAHRLDPQMVSLPHPDALASLVSRRGVSLYFATPPFSTVLDSTPGIHQVSSSKAILGEEITGAMLATTGRFAAQPGQAAMVVDALTEANRLIAQDPARAAALYLESESSKLGAAEVEGLIRSMAPLYSVAPSGTVAMAAFMRKQGELKLPLPQWQDAFFPPVSAGTGS